MKSGKSLWISNMKKFSVYRCLSCGHLVKVEDGNYHPWCLCCMYDQFDWATGYNDITEEEADRIIEKDR